MDYANLHNEHLTEWDTRVKNMEAIFDALPFSSFTSLIDVGCGLGASLVAAKRKFTLPENSLLVGLDGQSALENAPTESRPYIHKADLEAPINLNGQKFDIALCLEVAEHLSPQRAPSLVKDLTDLSDVIVFSAAMPLQGGVGHINERLASYWVGLFERSGFGCFDCLRFNLSSDSFPWFRQNLLLFIKKSSPVARELSKVGIRESFSGNYYCWDLMEGVFYNYKAL